MTTRTQQAGTSMIDRGLWEIRDALVITRRNLLKYVRVPTLLVFSTVQPVMFVLLFAFVFGGAIYWPHDVNYAWDLFRQPLTYDTDYQFAEQNFRTDLDVLENRTVVFVDGVVVATNHRFEEVLGYAPGEVIGLNVAADNRPARRLYEALGFVAVLDYDEAVLA